MMTKFISALLGASLLAAPVFAQDAIETPPARITDFALTEAPNEHAMGSEDAALTMIVWASVTCPHCGTWFSEEWATVKTELVDTGLLRVVFREFPTAPAQLAMTGFLLAECAPSEDYMSIIEYQMENQEMIFEEAKAGRGREVYDKIAKMAGMEDDDAITACMRNPDMVAHIQDNAERAAAAKVRGVPAFFINGESYGGASDAKSLITLITEMEDKGLSALPEDAISKASDHAGHAHD